MRTKARSDLQKLRRAVVTGKVGQVAALVGRVGDLGARDGQGKTLEERAREAANPSILQIILTEMHTRRRVGRVGSVGETKHPAMAAGGATKEQQPRSGAYWPHCPQF